MVKTAQRNRYPGLPFPPPGVSTCGGKHGKYFLDSRKPIAFRRLSGYSCR
nr:MAG TPA: hypothetical protein [Caudoviricetes sp.]